MCEPIKEAHFHHRYGIVLILILYQENSITRHYNYTLYIMTLLNLYFALWIHFKTYLIHFKIITICKNKSGVSVTCITFFLLLVVIISSHTPESATCSANIGEMVDLRLRRWPNT